MVIPDAVTSVMGVSLCIIAFLVVCCCVPFHFPYQENVDVQVALVDIFA